ncbi:MAG: hypothetical protein MUE60_03870 [Candidatus Eisenbacteria bacterium]|nr:hypothetical protein [Candidatus Eisenbacteria bacterium]
MADMTRYPFSSDYARSSLLAAVAALLAVWSCAHAPHFVPGPWVSPSPDSLTAIDTLAVSGRVMVTDGSVRHRARWAMAGCADALRLQVFTTDGSCIADIGYRGDSLIVLLPGAVECHRGPADRIPVDSLLGIPVPWAPALSVLHAALWPQRLSPPWTPGTLGRRRGWYSETDGIFIEPDSKTRLPRFMACSREGSGLTAEVRAWESDSLRAFPSELRLSWPARGMEMWINLSVRRTEGVGSAALRVACPSGAPVVDW